MHVVSQTIEGSIVRIGEDGNLISDISADRLAGVPTDERTLVTCDEHQTMGIFTLDHDQPPMTLIAVLGESGHLELRVVGDSARIMLGVGVGERVVVQW